MGLQAWYQDSALGCLLNEPTIKRTVKDMLAASQNNYDLGLSDGAVVYDIRASAAINITGIVAPNPAAFQCIALRNVGENTITLKDASGSSTAANRLLGFSAALASADVALAAGAWVPLIYDTAQSRWVIGVPIPRMGARLVVVTASGAWLLLNGAFFSLKHMSYEHDGATANAGMLAYRYGVSPPVIADLTGDSAQKRESLPIVNGQDEVIQIPVGTLGMRLLPASGTDLSVALRKNENGFGLNR